METYFPFLREKFLKPPVLRLRKSLSGRLSSLVLFAGMSIASLTASASLAAQQTDVDNPRTVFLSASTAATPATDADAQAPAAPAQSSSTNAPAPQNQSTQGAQEGSGDKQTKRILEIIPNFRAVSADEKLPPQPVKEKFITATEDSFDYSSIFVPAVLAGYDMEINATPEFHQGAAGFARYFWHAAVDQTSENYMVEFVVPSLTHEDTRYYTLGHGGFIKRTGYALSRAVVTRSDSGKETFNLSEVIGAGAASGISSFYYPSRERSLSNTGTEWGLDIGIDAAAFWVKEFWPDINHRLFHSAKASPSPQH